MPRKKTRRVRFPNMTGRHSMPFWTLEPRATWLEAVSTPTVPPHWLLAPRLARVRLDHGPECYVAARRAVRIKDADWYEAAFQDPVAHIAALLTAGRTEQTSALAALGEAPGAMIGQALWEGEERVITVSVSVRAIRLAALLRQLSQDEAVAAVQALLKKWRRRAAGDPWREDVCGALGFLLSERGFREGTLSDRERTAVEQIGTALPEDSAVRPWLLFCAARPTLSTADSYHGFRNYRREEQQPGEPDDAPRFRGYQPDAKMFGLDSTLMVFR